MNNPVVESFLGIAGKAKLRYFQLCKLSPQKFPEVGGSQIFDQAHDTVQGSHIRSLVNELPTETWTRQWRSFIYGKQLERSSPEGRIGERMSVAVGALHPKLYAEDLSDWRTDRLAVTTTLRDTWARSVVVGAVVGEAKELEPLVRKHFPQHEVIIIPYTDPIRDNNPTLVLSDGILGQMMEPAVIQKKDNSINYDKSSWALTGAKVRKPYIIRSLFLDNVRLEQLNKKIARKLEQMEKNVNPRLLAEVLLLDLPKV